MLVRELVEEPGPGLKLLGGPAGAGRGFEAVTITDLPDPGRYLRGGELVLSGLMWLADPRGSVAARCDVFVGAVARLGCAALAAGDTTDDPLPGELVAACERLDVPLLQVPGRLAFTDLADWVAARVQADRALRRAGRDLVALAGRAGPAAVRETLAEVSGAVRPPGSADPRSHADLLAVLPGDMRRGYLDRLLGPVRDYDARHRTRLEETLEAFLACSASWNRCARGLHIHVNTLRYRMEKIGELTGRDPSRLDDLVNLHLALRLR